MKHFWLAALAGCIFGITPVVACGQPLFAGAESIDCTVTNADLVVVGTIVAVENESTDAATVTLAVESSLKGEHRDRLRFRTSRPVPATRLDRSARLLVALREDPPVAAQVIHLSGERVEVLTADFTLLRKPEDVIRAAREAVRRMPGVRQIQTFTRVVPNRVVAGTRWEQYYQTGGSLRLDVPVDERLEKCARESITTSAFMDREEVARALRFFRSDENEARLKSLLTDPGWSYLAHAEDNMGVEVRHHGVRAEAYQALKSWGIKVDEPVTRVEIIKRELVTLVDLQHRPRLTDADLDDLARFPNLVNLLLTHSPVTDARLKRLAGLKGLRTLEIGGTEVTDAGIEELAALEELEHLSMGLTKVTDAGLPTLVRFPRLITLDLNQTEVTDAALGHLAGLRHLRALDLRSTRVTDAGVAELLRLCPNLKITR